MWSLLRGDYDDDIDDQVDNDDPDDDGGAQVLNRSPRKWCTHRFNGPPALPSVVAQTPLSGCL